MRRTAATLLLLLLAAAPARRFRLGGARPGRRQPRRPPRRLPADPEDYDPATHCTTKPAPGMVAFVGWLQRNARGVVWGTYRCEKWGPHEASLHAENRAVDWHLDVPVPADRAAAAAPDRAPAGARQRRHAARARAPDGRRGDHLGLLLLGRRDAGLQPYSPCLNKHGERRKRVDPTVGHRNHLHFGMSKAGAAARTSFWR